MTRQQSEILMNKCCEYLMQRNVSQWNENQKRIALRSSTSNDLLIYDRLNNESYVNLIFHFNILCKMALASEIFRNPLSEHLSINQLMALGPVQPINIDHKSTIVLVAGTLVSEVPRQMVRGETVAGIQHSG